MTDHASPRTTNIHVAICACTYQRPAGLKDLLNGIAKLQFSLLASPLITIVIADNEISEVNKQICDAFTSRSGIPLRYVPVVERGISFARNACFDYAPKDTDFIAFIDDDEIPEPAWLEQLLMVQSATDSDVVYGPVYPAFAEHTPDWIRQNRLFLKPPRPETLQDHQTLPSAATCNCLLRMDMIKRSGIRFDPALALSGGEDKLYFLQLNSAGYRTVWAAHAVVHETIPPERATLHYLLRLQFRLGNISLPVKLTKAKYTSRSKRKIRLLIKTLNKAMLHIFSGLGIILLCPVHWTDRKIRFTSGLLRIAKGLGILSSITGYKYAHYR